MGISSRLMMAVVSTYKKAADENTARFKNLANFLGIDLSKQKKPTAKEASLELEAVAKAKFTDYIRDWFFGGPSMRKDDSPIMKDYLPYDYVDQDNRQANEILNDMYTKLPSILHASMKSSLKENIADVSKKLNYPLESEDVSVVYDDELIDEKVTEMLGYYQNNKPKLESTIQKTISQKSRDTETDSDEVSDDIKGEFANAKKYKKPGAAKMWFTPTVTPMLYKNYVSYIEQKKGKIEEKATEEGKKVVAKPEDMGIFKDRADPYLIKILGEMGKFHIDIHGHVETTDRGEAADEYTFSIPELADSGKGGNAKLYGDILFTKKFPASFRSIVRANKLLSISVTDVKENSLNIQVDTIQKEDVSKSVGFLREHGFGSYEKYSKFINTLVRDYVKSNILKSKNMDELIEFLGGDVKIRLKDREESKKKKLKKNKPGAEPGSEPDDKDQKRDTAKEYEEEKIPSYAGKTVSVTSVADLESLPEFGGKSVTKEQLQSTQEKEEIIEYSEKKENQLKAQIDAAVAVWDKEMQEANFAVDSNDGAAMIKTVAATFPSLREVINSIKEGNKQIGFPALLRTSEIIERVMKIIFEETTSSGPHGWKVHFINYLKKEGMASDLFKEAIKVLLYRDHLLSKKVNDTELFTKLRDLGSKAPYSDNDIKEYLNKRNLDGAIEKGASGLRSSIKEAINDNKNSPAFHKFFNRIELWKSYINKDIKNKVSRVLDGDDKSPIPIPANLKGKMVSEREELDVRIDPKKLEKEIEDLEKEKKRIESRLSIMEVQFDQDEEWEEIDGKLKALKGKKIKKQRIDPDFIINEKDGRKWLNQLIRYYMTEKVQQAYVQDPGALQRKTQKKDFHKNVVKMAMYSLKIKGSN